MLHALGLAAAVVISFSAIMIRLADVSPSTAAFFRPFYALPLIALLYLATRRSDTRSAGSRWACLAAGALMGVSFTLWNYSIGYVGAGLATVLGNTQVVFVALVAWLVLRERPPLGALLAAPLVFLGVVLVSGVGRPDAYGAEPVLGVLYGIANALAYATFLLVFRRAARGLSRPSGPLLDATLGAAAMTFLLGVATDPAFDLVPSWPAHGWLALLAAGSQVLGWWIILTVLPRLPALDTSVLLLAQPMLTVVWGRLWFAELLSPLQWGGVALVVLGVSAMTLWGAWSRAAAARADPPPGSRLR
jgi:drug/metabolite transporter (DMT)-like permease